MAVLVFLKSGVFNMGGGGNTDKETLEGSGFNTNEKDDKFDFDFDMDEDTRGMNKRRI